jgi:Anaerobic dehydrogenases, typically selenocysteine-containing
MAECHPVGFQWVMEAKARGAKVIHIDPRFTRTSALADQHVPLRAGSDIVFLGGIVNYILTNERFFREYVVAYTNAATLVSDDFQDVDDLDGIFSGYDPETGTYDPTSWAYKGAAEHAAGGDREAASDDGDDGGKSPASGHELGGKGASHEGAADVERDETLQDPRCVFQVLNRHYARYTPEMVEGRSLPGRLPRGLRGRDREQRARPHDGLGLLSRLDATLRGRAVHPRCGHHPAPAGQHGPARWWHLGAARAREHPGLDRHPDPVQHPARIPPHAEGR